MLDMAPSTPGSVCVCVLSELAVEREFTYAGYTLLHQTWA